MKIRYMSDLHLCMEAIFDVSVHDDDNETTLVLAGDVGLAFKPITFVPFIEEMAKRFKYVIYVLGNHEHYGSVLPQVESVVKQNLNMSNVFVLQNEAITLDGVKIIGATMWTDFNNKNPMDMYMIKNGMSDFSTIRIPYRNSTKLILPDDIIIEYEKSVKFITGELSLGNNEKTVVVTHHAPSEKSIDKMYISSNINYGYVSRLDELLLTHKPKYWIHGHTHTAFNYMIGDTTVLCNPRGYKIWGQFEPTGFNLDASVTV